MLAGLSATYGFTPVAEAQFFSQSTCKLLRPLDETTRQAYRDSIVEFAVKNKPRYLGIGIEVNVLYEKSPADFDAFVGFFSEVYEAIKEKSPDTNVFTVFQLEKMKGFQGGLFGGANGNAEWSLLDRFPDTDMVAFTTYPCLVFKSPSAIPDGYYTEIAAHTTKPVAFTEVGWYSAADIPG